MGNYVDLLDPAAYHAEAGEVLRRHRVRNNLGGIPAFCPLIRRTQDTNEMRLNGLRLGIQDALSTTPEPLLRRAASSLLFGETLTTYAIEQIRPHRDKHKE